MNRLNGARVKRTQARRAHQEGGYTVIELVMAMGVFAIGITGISAMQAATSASNRHAKNLAIANAIAKTWHEELAVDATQWTVQNDAIGLAQTNWVKQVALGDLGTAPWFLPATVGTMGASFDALGNFTTDAEQTVFCTHIRLTRLIRAQGSGLIRADVRVFWPRFGHDWTQQNYCSLAATPDTFAPFAPGTTAADETEVDNFHFVYSTSAIRQTSQ